MLFRSDLEHTGVRTDPSYHVHEGLQAGASYCLIEMDINDVRFGILINALKLSSPFMSQA